MRAASDACAEPGLGVRSKHGTGASAAPLMGRRAAAAPKPTLLWIHDSWLLVSHGIFLRMRQVRPTLRGETTRMQCCEVRSCWDDVFVFSFLWSIGTGGIARIV
jgi:hypothetical protein